MNIRGRKPKSRIGAEFNCNPATWQPIFALVTWLGRDIFPLDELLLMKSRDGNGPDQQELCDKLADRFNLWMEHNGNGFVGITGVAIEKDSNRPVGIVIGQPPNSPGVDDATLKRWVHFLYNCGGFAVW